MLKTVAIRQFLHVSLSSALVLACCFFLSESHASSNESVPSKNADTPKKEVNDPKFHKQLLQIAAEYQGYGKVDDMTRWAPTLCMMPPPPKARLSKSKDSGTHGKKLYYLFAKHRNEYMENKTDVAGQVVVKESWGAPSTEALKANIDKSAAKAAAKETTSAFTTDVLGAKSGLYIMYRADAKSPDTDDGWIYGTVTADGKTVTSAGRVQSCMSCHISAPHGRLFGLQQ